MNEVPRLPIDPPPSTEPPLWHRRPETRAAIWAWIKRVWARLWDAVMVAGGVSFMIQGDHYSSSLFTLLGIAMIVVGLLSLTSKDRQ